MSFFEGRVAINAIFHKNKVNKNEQDLYYGMPHIER